MTGSAARSAASNSLKIQSHLSARLSLRTSAKNISGQHYRPNEKNREQRNSSPNGYPVKLTFDGEQEFAATLFLEGTAIESIADSIKRIADAMTAQRG